MFIGICAHVLVDGLLGHGHFAGFALEEGLLGGCSALHLLIFGVRPHSALMPVELVPYRLWMVYSAGNSVL